MTRRELFSTMAGAIGGPAIAAALPAPAAAAAAKVIPASRRPFPELDLVNLQLALTEWTAIVNERHTDLHLHVCPELLYRAMALCPFDNMVDVHAEFPWGAWYVGPQWKFYEDWDEVRQHVQVSARCRLVRRGEPLTYAMGYRASRCDVAEEPERYRRLPGEIRRSWFAAIAAAFAGRKARPYWRMESRPPVAMPQAMADHFADVMLPAIDAAVFKTYTPASYGLGFTISRELLDDDRLHCLAHRQAVIRQRIRDHEERLAAEMYRLGFPPD